MADVKYEWTDFYEKMDKALLQYKNNRSELLSVIDKIIDKINLKNPLLEKTADGKKNYYPMFVLLLSLDFLIKELLIKIE